MHARLEGARSYVSHGSHTGTTHLGCAPGFEALIVPAIAAELLELVRVQLLVVQLYLLLVVMVVLHHEVLHLRQHTLVRCGMMACNKGEGAKVTHLVPQVATVLLPLDVLHLRQHTLVRCDMMASNKGQGAGVTHLVPQVAHHVFSYANEFADGKEVQHVEAEAADFLDLR